MTRPRWRLALLGLLPWAAVWAQGESGMLQGYVVPDMASAPFPVVVMLHGCNGVDPNIPMWQQFFRSRGYASVVVDSFGRRRIHEICTDLRRVPAHERVNDAYKALTELVRRPDVDPQRIVVMGFSHGGVATLAALTNTVAAQLPKDHPRFSAGIAVYPECGPYAYATFSKPVLVLAGALDDWTPPAPCVALATKFAQTQPRFQTIVYPKAHHGFDIPGLPYRYWGNATNLNKRSGYGATVEGNEAARVAALGDATAFLDRLFASPPVPVRTQ